MDGRGDGDQEHDDPDGGRHKAAASRPLAVHGGTLNIIVYEGGITIAVTCVFVCLHWFYK